MNKKGRLGDDCDATGDEFWPLMEKDYYGNVNPYQDPSRGRIENFSTGDYENDFEGMVQGVLLNLAGRESIIGKSLSLFVGEEEIPRGCCVIGEDHSPAEMAAMDETPETTSENPETPAETPSENWSQPPYQGWGQPSQGWGQQRGGWNKPSYGWNSQPTGRYNNW